MKTVMILAIVCMMCMLYGYDAIAGEWSQNLDAKPIELPLGLKFGEVYGGEIVSTRTNYMNGIESKSCHAVITNNWCGFEEIVIMMTGERRVDGVLGTKRDFKDFDEAITNLVALKEALSKKYGIRFMGDKAPKTIGDDEQLWSLTGIGADDENVSLRAAGIWRKKGEGNPTINLCLGIQSGLAAKIESKELEAEAAGLRSAIKEVFGVDFDTPQPKPLWGFDWEKLATPIEGLTEKRCNTAYTFDGRKGNLIESVSFRHVFDGDVSSAELEAAARRIVIALEKAYGKRLPDDRKNLQPLSGKDYGIPAAYDTATRGANQHYVAYGAVGTFVVSIEYAEPRYALREGKYELVFKGGIKFSVSRAGWLR